ncbi:5-formyltetrahydrofolate cyclo-ligase [Mucilaginibacter robiniae]|uniref:5-formyltetrahydrofolate cyclo-ligase n=1 Tax=Mucilaginibacter robiniae TaxID=2728022 RepID=A0A7L5E3E8_9SPHI|nr:5-formyltetrahydrofolate cyclo-ligase [Mucilaginibacter robiniae]QJD96174.1 5-formyltetrahydrofolate cyclo-ligase [Mucilaginibacter robiniae]
MPPFLEAFLFNKTFKLLASLTLTKAELRKLFINKRKQLSLAEYGDLNQKLLLQFTQLDLQGVHCIHLFLPIHERKEPDTFLMREWLSNHHPQITQVFPKANFADYTMQNFADDAQLELATNAFGIPEPVNGNKIETTTIDLILIPLLAFDLKGYRVGYGKGFYDRFIAQCRPDVRLVGISLFEPIEVVMDVNEFDQKMQQCITPNKIYIF